MSINNFDISKGKFNECDLIGDFTVPINKTLSLSAGGAYLMFPNTQNANTYEVSFGMSANVPIAGRKIPPLAISARAYYDFGQGKGTYGEFSFTQEIPISDKTSLISKGLVAYNNHYFTHISGFSHAALSFSLPVKLGKDVSLVPSTMFQKSLNERITKDEIVAGVSVDFSKVLWK